MAEHETQVMFVHGLWLHATSWGPWIERFGEAGHRSLAPGWPGEADTVEETRLHPDRVAGFGIDEIVEHLAGIAGRLEARPVVIGHSFGGLFAQRLLAEGHASAAVAIDPAPIRGVYRLPLSALRVASVALRSPLNRRRAVSLSREQFRYGFGNALGEEESDALFARWAIPSPGTPLFEAAFANLVPRSPARVATGNPTRGPLLLTAGGLDHTVPPTVTHQTARRYRRSGAVTDVVEFADRGHSLTIDHGWGEVAATVLDWLEATGLPLRHEAEPAGGQPAPPPTVRSRGSGDE